LNLAVNIPVIGGLARLSFEIVAPGKPSLGLASASTASPITGKRVYITGSAPGYKKDDLEALVTAAGGSFIFTNRNEWTTVDIAKTYRAQKGVEDQFKALNVRDSISVHLAGEGAQGGLVGQLL